MTVPPPPPSHIPPTGPLPPGPYGYGYGATAPPGVPWQPVVRPPLSGMAVASLVLSLLVCLAPVGLVLGIVALVRIPRNGKRGKGLAVAGTAVGASVVALSVLLVAVGGARFSTWTVDGPREAAAGTLFGLREGDCFTPGSGLPTKGDPRLKDLSAEVVECEKPHQGEVYGSFQLEDGGFPGTESVAASAYLGCAPLLHDFALDSAALPQVQLFFYHPDATGWTLGNRTVLCWVGPPAGLLEKSLRQDVGDWDEGQLAYLTALRPASEARASRPGEGPEKNLAGATDWAGRMAEGEAESARLLRAADGLPAGARGPAEAFADRLDALSAKMREASKARTEEEFRERMVSSGEGDGAGEEGRVRAAVGLPLPGGGDMAG
ncbi:membrane protein [Streptomyces microflavus]|uniref:Membrane protein n=2 Tax=Streptomyces TaxID=1883 RepID=A0A7J0CW07_STRMI|nr:membrane protein [Streptomyces microflavus]GGX81300.1 membrane protein [Streptomyces microflavus]